VQADTSEVVLGAGGGEVSFRGEPGSQVHVALFHLGTGDPVTDRWILIGDVEVEFSCVDAPCEVASETGTGETGEGAGGAPAGGCGCVGSRGGPAWLLWVSALSGRRRGGRRPKSRTSSAFSWCS
jgi:hypothetical protein